MTSQRTSSSSNSIDEKTTKTSSNSGSLRLQSVQEHYARFIRRDIDDNNDTGIPGNAKGLEGLGYDSEFLQVIKSGLAAPPANVVPTGTKNPGIDVLNTSTTPNKEDESLQRLLSTILEPSCGSGCPLRLLRWFNNETTKSTPTLALGSTVVDLGCGAGHDVLLASAMLRAASRAKPHSYSSTDIGHVIGIDVTEEMLVVAERNTALIQKYLGRNNNDVRVEWIHEAVDAGIPELELAGQLSAGMADVVMSNSVFNLTPDKEAAFAMAYWLLKPGGRFLLSDVCQVEERPEPGAFYSPFNSSSNSSAAVIAGGGDPSASWGT